MRLHSTTFDIKSEASEKYPLATVYYIGLRVRKDVEIKNDLIDLTMARRAFFDEIEEKLNATP